MQPLASLPSDAMPRGKPDQTTFVEVADENPVLAAPNSAGGTLLGLPHPAWIIVGVELVERLGYYAVSFSLFTYCTHMLRTGPIGAAAIINGVYVMIPAAACIASGLADGRWGRPRTLQLCLGAYAAGLLLLTLSSFPMMYVNFPIHARVISWVLFSVALLLFGTGYGGMKVCTNPLMADSITSMYQHRAAEITAPLCETAPLQDLSANLEADLSRAFRFIYCATNFGSLIGMFAAPLLRGLDGRHVFIGSVAYTTGYYYGFGMASGSVLVSLGLFLHYRHLFPRGPRAPSFVLFRLMLRALTVRCQFTTGLLHDSEGLETLRAEKNWLWYGTYRRGLSDVVVESTPPSASCGPHERSTLGRGEEGTLYTVDSGRKPVVVDGAADWSPISGAHYDAEGGTLEVSSRAFVLDCTQALQACRAFVALPIYWLITNQFSSTLMYSLEALALPPLLPPDVFNNINTITLLTFLAAVECWGFPTWWGGGRTPSTRSRVCAGFGLMIASMLWCAGVEMGVASRGYYDGDGTYNLREGETRLSGGWLVTPYIMQGLAAALVDPATMEVAYTAAPERMKGTVMGLYWVASSLSGFLGVALSPIMKPQNATGLYLGFAISLACVSVLFYALNQPGAYENVSLRALDRPAENNARV